LDGFTFDGRVWKNSGTGRAEGARMKGALMRWFFCVFLLGAASVNCTDDVPALDESEWQQLAAGECVILDRRPDDAEKPDGRFVTAARHMEGTRETIWEVIHDKERAAEFLEGVLESKLLEKEGNRLLVEQRTHVGGPKGSYVYRLRHELTPMSKATFTYAGGELKDVVGAWWIFDGPSPEICLVVYSLYIDAGFFAPQAIVKAGMKKTMPKTLASIAREVAKRQSNR